MSTNIDSTDRWQLRNLIEREVYRELSARRFEHCRRVADCAWELSLRFGMSGYKAYVAGIAHDLAREWPVERLTARAADDGLPMSELERKDPVLLHGRVAALELQERFGIAESDLLEAVRHHTLGAPRLGDLAHLLYVADYTEPGRPHMEADLQEALDEADSVASLVCIVVDHARSLGKVAAPETMMMYRELQELMSA